jgi:hypothetical protein
MNRLLDPVRIDTGFMPRLRMDVITIDVGDEAVLYEEHTGALHQLDAIGAVVCAFFDGKTSIEETVAALAAAYATGTSVIETDVLELARSLGRRGLLVGVQGEAPPAETTDGC